MFASGTGAPAAGSAICRLCTAALPEASDDAASIDLFGDTGQHCNAVHIVFKHYDIDIRSTDPYSKRICVSCWRITSDFHKLFEQVQLAEQELNTRCEPADADVNTEVLTKIGILPILEVKYDDVDVSKNRSEAVRPATTDATSDPGSCGDEAMGATGDDDDGAADTTDPTSEIDAVIEAEDRRIAAHFQMSCDQCEQDNFRSLVQMNRHCCNEHGTYAFLVCCNQKFFDIDKALAHIDQHDASVDATHQCDGCDAKFAGSGQLERHRTSVHAVPITPPQTPMAISTRLNTAAKSIAKNDGTMDIDVDAMREAEDRRICLHFEMSCDQCEKNSFRSLVQMNRHCSDEHGTYAFLACDGRKFYDNDEALAHIDQHEEVRRLDAATYACDRCDASFAKGMQLKRHRISVHGAPPAIPKPSSTRKNSELIANIDGNKDLHRMRKTIYSCDLCSTTFDQDAQLRRHRRLEHDEGQKPDGRRSKAATKVNGEPKRCDKCDKSFVNKYVLATHVSRVHDNMFTLMCHVCAKTFKSKQVFEQHQRDVHAAGLALPKLQCTICGNWLKHEHSLRKHMARHFQSQQTCTLCGKVVPNEHALGNHMRYVHSDRVFKCTMCDKAFKKAIGLKEHLASHTGVDLYACPYCAQTFKSSANMYAHRKKRHLEQWRLDREQRLK